MNHKYSFGNPINVWILISKDNHWFITAQTIIIHCFWYFSTFIQYDIHKYTSPHEINKWLISFAFRVFYRNQSCYFRPNQKSNIRLKLHQSFLREKEAIKLTHPHYGWGSRYDSSFTLNASAIEKRNSMIYQQNMQYQKASGR